MELKVNNGREDCIFNIEEVEQKKNAKYVGEFCLRNRDGNWANEAVSVFYQTKPPIEGYSHYFALLARDGQVFVTSGESAIKEVIYGVEAKDGEIIYSRFRHDMRYSKDGSVFIDGGRDYTKSSTTDLVAIKVVDGKFTLHEFELKPSKPLKIK